jgi:hypothetical protein
LRDLVTNIANAMEIELQLLELTGWRPFFMWIWLDALSWTKIGRT